MQVRRHPSLPVYFAITFLLAWTLWFAATLLGGDSPSPFLFLPGTFAPGIVAVLLTARAEGPEGVRALLAPLFKWEVEARWYLFALLFLFVRFLPMISIFEMRTLLPEAQAHTEHGTDGVEEH